MKYLKMLGLSAVMAAALMAFVGAGSASATVLCKTNTTPCGAKYAVGESIAANLKTGTKAVLKAGFAVVECEESTIAGKITNAGSATTTVEGEITTLTFGKCNCTVKVLKNGNLVLHYTSEMNGNLTAAGFEIEVTCGEIKPCTFAGEVLTGLTFTGGNPFAVDAVEAPIPKKAGPATCNNPSKWTATYVAEGTNVAAWAAES